ncbi:chymotrypsin inhibitor-like [Chelonus insularis]|uniref:chymotrypsin inhibitor-like n=1 Tax=Chelonus insularis TaxID=460826 RepID=UPI00158D808C|nr:chymotrypsin inhibitor-like [Chelonus insularis]
MNTKTIVILFAITVVVLALTIDQAEAQRGRCRRRCSGGPQDRCVACGSRCPPTCRNPRPRCRSGCIHNVCQCAPGWVRAPGGRCVRPNQCPRSRG